LFAILLAGSSGVTIYLCKEIVKLWPWDRS
jgi:hypothetical protein